ncbi:hypothetical protein GJV56_18830 [Elizabethkingia anophelis]|uniref:hypothetical protein n=1 Tax=Elizabethkingia anophelis TaxID=1117645 RepID=UPI0012B2F169|nr:hypothetical protein [Elizabethkingia anophelis]QGN24615.1 hypothetical protein GJV56_18830 [Elizabethkingia anophelis]
MKTKYIAVPVSEILPEKEGEYLTNYDPMLFKDGRFTDIYQSLTFGVDNWYEEVPDHSEEMLYLLEDVKNKFKPSLSHPLEEGQEELTIKS